MFSIISLQLLRMSQLLLPNPYALLLVVLLPTPYSRLPTPYCLLPTPYSLLLTPYSLLPKPYSLLPTPYSLLLLPTPDSLLQRLLLLNYYVCS